ncbi:MAG: GNAT family N-acetyltransferase [Treponema sp.]|nr:GNAT family N-acetyltransferase [Treponema sp.]
MSIFQTKEYFETFGHKTKCILIDDNDYYYSIQGKECIVKALTIKLTSSIQSKLKEQLFKRENVTVIKFEGFKKDDSFIPGILEVANDCHILNLPSSFDEYTQSLGKKTRQHLRWYKRQLEKDDIKLELIIDTNVEDDFVFNEIYRLNNERCLSKGFESGARKEWIEVIKARGGIAYYKYNNTVLAGCIFTLCDDTLYLHTIAHDNAYNQYNIGNLILLDTIEFAISQNIKELNFLWGECEYKKRFNAVAYPLYRLTIYRSPLKYIVEKIKCNLKNLFIFTKKEIYSFLRFGYRIAKKIYKVLRGTTPKGTVYMLHRCAPADRNSLWPNENMKVYPDILDKQLEYCKKHYNCIAAKDVISYCKKPHLKKFVAFTFDDGYRDNYEYALPIFKKHNIPFTVFVAASFPEKNNIMWWYALEELLLSVDEVRLSNGTSFSCKSTEEKCNAFLEIRRQILKLDQMKLETELNMLFSDYEIDWHKPVINLSMDWNQIEEMAKESLVTIGGHTYSHYNLKVLPDVKIVEDDIKKGIQVLKSHGIDTEIFAYPFGTANEVSNREIDYLKQNDLGIQCAFLADGGCTTRRNKKQYALPRVFLSNKTEL